MKDDDSPKTPINTLLDNSASENQRILNHQRITITNLKLQASRKYQFVVTFSSLVISLGLIKVLFTKQIRSATWNVPDYLINRCLPSSLTMQNVTFRGIGSLNFILILGMMGLILILFLEISQYYKTIQRTAGSQLSNILEPSESDVVNTIILNMAQIRTANRILVRINFRITVLLSLFALVVTFVLLSILNHGLTLFLGLSMAIIGGLFASILWIYRVISSDGSSQDFHLFYLRGFGLDPSMIAFALLELYYLWIWKDYLLLIDHMLICQITFIDIPVV